MNRAFWNGRRVFLTGHTGFKGSWLALWLSSLGSEVTGYARAPLATQPLYDLLKLDGRITSVIGDVTDRARLETAIKDASPEIVIHMAAQPLVQLSYEDPVDTYNTNVMGTVHLLDVVRSVPSVRSTVIVTTDKCYQNNEWIWPYREADRLGGDDPYSNSKACAELVTHAFIKSYFTRDAGAAAISLVASARAGNVIGGGDWAGNRLIPDVVRAKQNAEKLVLRNPHATRPWQFVLEPLRGYLALAEALSESGTDFVGGWNFGPVEEDSQSVEWVVRRFCEHFDYADGFTIDAGEFHPEKQLLRLDISKAAYQLKWRPAMPLSEALRFTADWYAAHLRAEDDIETSLRQIAEYETLVGIG